MKSFHSALALLAVVAAAGCGGAPSPDANTAPAQQSTPQDTENTMLETPSGATTSTSAAPDNTEPKK
jgi:ABC-type glycerol-3-phosphate transport system substrate-binding protein